MLMHIPAQGDVEKQHGLPVGPVMDRDTVRKGSSQVFFINVFMLPMFQKLTKVWLQDCECYSINCVCTYHMVVVYSLSDVTLMCNFI